MHAFLCILRTEDNLGCYSSSLLVLSQGLSLACNSQSRSELVGFQGFAYLHFICAGATSMCQYTQIFLNVISGDWI